MAWRPERVQQHAGALFQPDGESLPSHPMQGSAPAAPMPVLPGLPRWPPLYPANCSSRSQGRPAARALPGEKANGPEPLGPLRVLSKSPFSPTPYSLNSFPLNLSGSSQRHFHPFHQTSQTSPFHRVLTHPAPVTGLLEERNWPAQGTSWSPVPTSPQPVTQKQQAKRICRAERRENRE